jgi:hypothetical protein
MALAGARGAHNCMACGRPGRTHSPRMRPACLPPAHVSRMRPARGRACVFEQAKPGGSPESPPSKSAGGVATEVSAPVTALSTFPPHSASYNAAQSPSSRPPRRVVLRRILVRSASRGGTSTTD